MCFGGRLNRFPHLGEEGEEEVRKVRKKTLFSYPPHPYIGGEGGEEDEG